MPNTTITNLQKIVTALSAQAIQHEMQARIFNAKGLTKLEEKYSGHAQEERENVVKFIDRIIDLGGEVKLETTQESALYQDPIEYIQYEIGVFQHGLKLVADMIKTADSDGDYTTKELLKVYYMDEEEDYNWATAQMDLIELIGEQNWYVKQL